MGTAVGAQSRVWFTLSHGIVNEVYYPRVDQANTRDLGFLVTAADGFVSEEKRHATHAVEPLQTGVPGYRLTNTCNRGRYRTLKRIVTDPARDVLLQQVHFEPRGGKPDEFRLFVLLAPHLGNQGWGNHGWIGEYKGHRMLFAARGATALALACSVPFEVASCGYVGVSDGWQDITRSGRLVQTYQDAPDGNVALAAQIGAAGLANGFVLALGFGGTWTEAGEQARASLMDPYEAIEAEYVRGWNRYQAGCKRPGPEEAGLDLFRVSTAVIGTHEDKTHAGAIIASLSVPWGDARGDHDLGGYHLVWPRDLVESATALFAIGQWAAARRTLTFLEATQESDGHWPQNMWLDGEPYWSGIQLDETGFPILLADLLRRHGALGGGDPWPMVRRAAGYLARVGPVTPQDRWEEDAGYSPFTLAVTVAALLAAADFADNANEHTLAGYFRDTADVWNAGIERWTYVTGSDAATHLGVEGFYARIAPPETADGESPMKGFVPVKNRPMDHSRAAYGELVSTDALALVRFGLRRADDPRIQNTVRVIDSLLCAETSTGPVWHRYNGDGYGEHGDGSPFDGTGRGRGWPLLAGERGHYELAAGNPSRARELLRVMGAQTSPGGFLPEQVWDAPDIPERELINGQPSGSAMPLVWAHAEYIKLTCSLAEGRVFDLPPQTVHRYLEAPAPCRLAVWRFNNKIRNMSPGRILRVEVLAPAVVHWSADDWRTVADLPTTDTGVGIYFADLPASALESDTTIRFTFRWPEADRWEGADFTVAVGTR